MIGIVKPVPGQNKAILSIEKGVIRLGSGVPPFDPIIQADLEKIRINQPSGDTIPAYDFVQKRFQQLKDGKYELPEVDSSHFQPPFVSLGQ